MSDTTLKGAIAESAITACYWLPIDLVQGKRLELEALHGHAVRLGERHGVPTPMVLAICAALKPHVAGRRG